MSWKAFLGKVLLVKEGLWKAFKGLFSEGSIGWLFCLLIFDDRSLDNTAVSVVIFDCKRWSATISRWSTVITRCGFHHLLQLYQTVYCTAWYSRNTVDTKRVKYGPFPVVSLSYTAVYCDAKRLFTGRVRPARDSTWVVIIREKEHRGNVRNCLLNMYE